MFGLPETSFRFLWLGMLACLGLGGEFALLSFERAPQALVCVLMAAILSISGIFLGAHTERLRLLTDGAYTAIVLMVAGIAGQTGRAHFEAVPLLAALFCTSFQVVRRNRLYHDTRGKLRMTDAYVTVFDLVYLAFFGLAAYLGPGDARGWIFGLVAVFGPVAAFLYECYGGLQAHLSSRNHFDSA